MFKPIHRLALVAAVVGFAVVGSVPAMAHRPDNDGGGPPGDGDHNGSLINISDSFNDVLDLCSGDGNNDFRLMANQDSDGNATQCGLVNANVNDAVDVLSGDDDGDDDGGLIGGVLELDLLDGILDGILLGDDDGASSSSGGGGGGGDHDGALINVDNSFNDLLDICSGEGNNDFRLMANQDSDGNAAQCGLVNVNANDVVDILSGDGTLGLDLFDDDEDGLLVDILVNADVLIEAIVGVV